MATPRRKSPSRRLLLLACSSRKVPSARSLPAIERYDGVAYRVIKKLQRLGQYPEDVDLLIVSAKYGIILHDQPIPDYDLRMTPERALEQAEQNRAVLQEAVRSGNYDEVFISAGKDYLLALEPFSDWQGTSAVTVNHGKIGVQLNTLKRWLLRERQTQLN